MVMRMVSGGRVDCFGAGDVFGGHCELTDCLVKRTENNNMYRLEGFKAQLHESRYLMFLNDFPALSLPCFHPSTFIESLKIRGI